MKQNTTEQNQSSTKYIKQAGCFIEVTKEEEEKEFNRGNESGLRIDSITLYKKNNNIWFGKEIEEQGPRCFNEVLIYRPMRLMIGSEFAPKCRIFNKNGKTILMSKKIEGFTTLHSLYRAKLKYYLESNVDTLFTGKSSNLDIKQKFHFFITCDEFYEHRKKIDLDITQNLENFEFVVASFIFFGLDDPHRSNIGIVTKSDGKKYAASIDYDLGISELTLDIIYKLFNRYGHKKEIICTENFAKACDDVVQKYNEQKPAIESHINSVLLYKNAVDEKLKILDKNALFLKSFAAQIRAEIIIKSENLDTEDLKKQLRVMEDNYFRRFTHQDSSYILSTQNDNSSWINSIPFMQFVTFPEESSTTKKTPFYEDNYIDLTEQAIGRIKSNEKTRNLIRAIVEVIKEKNSNSQFLPKHIATLEKVLDNQLQIIDQHNINTQYLSPKALEAKNKHGGLCQAFCNAVVILGHKHPAFTTFEEDKETDKMLDNEAFKIINQTANDAHILKLMTFIEKFYLTLYNISMTSPVRFIEKCRAITFNYLIPFNISLASPLDLIENFYFTPNNISLESPLSFAEQKELYNDSTHKLNTELMQKTFDSMKEGEYLQLSFTGFRGFSISGHSTLIFKTISSTNKSNYHFFDPNTGFHSTPHLEDLLSKIQPRIPYSAHVTLTNLKAVLNRSPIARQLIEDNTPIIT